nr:hypothetical protein [Sulfobacillus harzensis]
MPVPADVVAQGYSPAGYHWCNAHWGTEWEPDVQHDVPEIHAQADGRASADYLFDTAWSPPLAWLNAAAEQWPGLTFHLIYGEPGNNDYGEVIWEHGACVSEETIDPDANLEWIEEHFAWVLMQED